MLDSGKDKKRFLLLFGTATGQAQAIAEEIAEKCIDFGLVADLRAMDDIGKRYNLEEEKYVVIVTSTTGDGDPPPNAEKFMRRIKKRILKPDHFAHLNYALLGLGDTNYSNFARCARDVDSRLEALGAQRFYATGLADDGVGLEVVADPWLSGLYPVLQQCLCCDSSQHPSPEVVPPSNPTNHQSTSAGIGPAGDLPEKTNSSNGVDVVGTLSQHPNGTDHTEADSKTDSNPADKIGSNTDSISSPNSAVCNSTNLTDLDDLNGRLAKLDVQSSISVTLNGCDTKEASYSSYNRSQSSLNSDGKEEDKDSKVSKEETSPALMNGGVEHSDPEGSSHSRSARNDDASPRPSPADLVPSDAIDSVPVCPLTSSQPPLSGQTLTVPLLPPHFLQATFSDSSSEESERLSLLPYQNGCKLPSAASDIIQASISSAKILTSPDAVKKTLCLRFKFQESSKLTYCPGDSISVICPNNSREIKLLMDRLGISKETADKNLTLTVLSETKKRRAAVPPHIHPRTTLRHVLTTCVNIREVPSKTFIRALIEHTANPKEIRRMQELCSKEGGQDFTRCLREPHVTLLDFLYAFPSCNPPVETILEHLPRLQPRPYSACSCQEFIDENSLDIVFNVVDIKADKGTNHFYSRRGVCTGWLDDVTSDLQNGKDCKEIQIPVFMRSNQHFRPPDCVSKPVIMVGPGTGVAPFLGFLQQRALKRKQMSTGGVYGETWLFFGCRNRDKDFLFREDLESFVQDGSLTHLEVTFSRDHQETGTDVTARYVQDAIKAQSANLCRLLVEDEALVFVCGDAKNMAKDVGTAFEAILQLERGMSADDAHMFVMKKRIHKTYLEDVWV